MPCTYLRLIPRDPLIARDARAFDTGVRMRSLPWLYPSVFAGSFRSLVGQSLGSPVHKLGLASDLEKLAVAGPLLEVESADASALFFQSPADVVFRESDTGQVSALPLRPIPCNESHGDGCDLPGRQLQPAMFAPGIDSEFKPTERPAFWSQQAMTLWLADGELGPLVGPEGRWPSGLLKPIERDVRAHVHMDHRTGVGKDGQLFQTTGLDLTGVVECGAKSKIPGVQWRASLAGRVAAGAFDETIAALNRWSPIGGERRIAHWSVANPASHDRWSIPPALAAMLIPGRSRVRMILATPAHFTNGWCPGWLDGDFSGTVPGTGVRLRLVSACLDRWAPISGWQYKEPKGPKPLRRLAPAGSTYFFEVESGDVRELCGAWLQPVSDCEQDRLDGFGLALWGTWNPHQK